MSEKKVLVVCVDRDNDIGIKTRITGPIIGRKANLDAANKLALKDPTDSDVNAVFQAIKTYDDIKKSCKAEIVTLTGDAERGIKSDRKLINQLEKTLRDFHPNEAILVSDGEDDEYVIPLLRSKVRIIFPQRVIVKQSAKLESAYYQIYDLLKTIQSEPKLARLFFGVPALALLIYAIFGSAGWRLIVGVVGSFFLIKGFHLESYVNEWVKEFRHTIYHRRLSFLLYFIAIFVAILGIFRGYNAVYLSGIESIFYVIAKFINSSIFIFALSVLIVGIAKAYRYKIKAFAAISYLMLLIAITWIGYTVTEYLLMPSIGYTQIAYSVVVSVILITITQVLERKR